MKRGVMNNQYGVREKVLDQGLQPIAKYMSPFVEHGSNFVKKAGKDSLVGLVICH